MYLHNNSCGDSVLTQFIKNHAPRYIDNEYPNTRKWCYITENSILRNYRCAIFISLTVLQIHKIII